MYYEEKESHSQLSLEFAGLSNIKQVSLPYDFSVFSIPIAILKCLPGPVQNKKWFQGPKS